MATIITMCVISPDEKLVMPSSMSGAAPDREYINRRLTIGSGEKEDDDDTVREKEGLSTEVREEKTKSRSQFMSVHVRRECWADVM